MDKQDVKTQEVMKITKATFEIHVACTGISLQEIEAALSAALKGLQKNEAMVGFVISQKSL